MKSATQSCLLRPTGPCGTAYLDLKIGDGATYLLGMGPPIFGNPGKTDGPIPARRLFRVPRSDESPPSILDLEWTMGGMNLALTSWSPDASALQ